MTEAAAKYTMKFSEPIVVWVMRVTSISPDLNPNLNPPRNKLKTRSHKLVLNTMQDLVDTLLKLQNNSILLELSRVTPGMLLETPGMPVTVQLILNLYRRLEEKKC